MGCVVTKQDDAIETPNMDISTGTESTTDDIPQIQQLSNGDVFIPINGVTGQYIDEYPKWLRNDISPQKYDEIINELNDLNTIKNYLNWNDRQKHSKHKSIKKEKKKLEKEIKGLLLTLNENTLNPLGLNMVYDKSQNGIFIKHIHIKVQLDNDKLMDNAHLVILPIYEYENRGT